MTLAFETDALKFAQELIRCRSVTPDQGGALDFIEKLLLSAGFTCHRLCFSDDDTPDVENLFARIGDSKPHLSFAGHVDVVPPGDENRWTHPPFSGEVSDGKLYGRGAADMKGGVACFVAAALDYLSLNPDGFNGSLSFIITADEEGPAINGTRKLLNWMSDRSIIPDFCVLGEPTNERTVGQTIKVGRRGSLNGTLTVRGKQGHVAYQELAHNPVPGLLSALNALNAIELDNGTEHFSPSNLEITTIDIGNPSQNVIPGEASAKFNIRFNDTHTSASLIKLLQQLVQKALDGFITDYELSFRITGESFLTEPGPLTDIFSSAVTKHTGLKPEYSTSGGTSDARFIKDLCPVIEFGLCNKTIHQIDENVRLEDLEKLREIYLTFIRTFLKSP